MYISKVYLAKSNLANGLDVEYVKSNLSRIPNLQVLEYGSGTPEEADCLVIVNDSKEKDFSKEIYINKNISKALESYLSEKSIENVFVYTGTKKSDSGDIEKTTPICLTINSFVTEIEEEEKEDNWQNHAVITLLNISINLLDSVSSCANSSGWRKYTRHYVQEPKYAMPPIPSADARQSVKRLKSIRRMEFNDNVTVITFNESKGSNISIRRRKRSF